LELLRRKARQAFDWLEPVNPALLAYAEAIEVLERTVKGLRVVYGDRASRGVLSQAVIKNLNYEFGLAWDDFGQAQLRLEGVLGRARPPSAPDLLRPDLVFSPSTGWALTFGADNTIQALDLLLARRSAPEDIAAWWGSLDPTEQATLEATRHQDLGNLDGIPAAVRNRANRRRLAEDHRRLTNEIAALEAQLAAIPHNPNAGMTGEGAKIQGLKNQLATLRDQLAAADAVQSALAGEKKVPRHLLVWDISAGTPKAAVSEGDVDTASNIMIQAPGINTTVAGNLNGWVNDMSDLRDLAAEMNETGGQMAVVAWLGYDTPGILPPGEALAIASQDRAQEGAASLGSFTRGVVAARGGDDPYVVLSGHSYGSTVAGLAVSDPRVPVDRFVAEGSPGIGSGPIRPDVEYYALQAEGLQLPFLGDGDYVPPLTQEFPLLRMIPAALTGGLTGIAFEELAGRDALGTQALYACTRLSTQAGENPMDDGQINPQTGEPVWGPLTDSNGHSQYFAAQSMSQYNLAALLAGRLDLLVTR
jgi:hypothetical protein